MSCCSSGWWVDLVDYDELIWLIVMSWFGWWWWVDLVDRDELIWLMVMSCCGSGWWVDLVDGDELNHLKRATCCSRRVLQTVYDSPRCVQSYWGVCECRGHKHQRAGGTGSPDRYGWGKYSIWLDPDQQHLTWEDVLHWTIAAQKSMRQSSSTAAAAVVTVQALPRPRKIQYYPGGRASCPAALYSRYSIISFCHYIAV